MFNDDRLYTVEAHTIERKIVATLAIYKTAIGRIQQHTTTQERFVTADYHFLCEYEDNLDALFTLCEVRGIEVERLRVRYELAFEKRMTINR